MPTVHSNINIIEALSTFNLDKLTNEESEALDENNIFRSFECT